MINTRESLKQLEQNEIAEQDIPVQQFNSMFVVESSGIQYSN
jgi:hypothetical protein